VHKDHLVRFEYFANMRGLGLALACLFTFSSASNIRQRTTDSLGQSQALLLARQSDGPEVKNATVDPVQTSDRVFKLVSGQKKIDTPDTPSLRRVALGTACVLAGVLVLGGILYVIYLFSSGSTRTLLHSYMELGACFLGLVISFVLYGIIQEYIMTQEYNGGKFPSSSFLVFCNRILGFLVCSCILLVRRESCFPQGSLYCSIPAMTLTVSTMCQYSSLRYVSFPTQVTFKSGKIVPTMAVGTFVTGTSYGWKDYAKALAITVCVIGFSLSMEHSKSHSENATKLIGVGLMCLFLLCDALTSNGEKRIFNTYEAMSHWQMMFMMAMFAVVYTGISIAFHNPLGLFAFLMKNPMACGHIFFLSVFAVSGSLFTFYIIKRYGPVIFSIMMTIRQIFSMTFSAILFGHEMGGMACFFAAAIFLILLGDAGHKFWTSPAKKAGEEKVVKDDQAKQEKATP